jgi:uncharacterized membrane protein
MIDSLLKIFGVKVGEAQQVTSVNLQLRNTDWLGWAVFLALLLGAFGWWIYRYAWGHRDLAQPRQRLLSALRIALLLLILLLLLRPVLSFKIESRIRRTLITLIDQSSSMDIRDPRISEPDVRRAAIAKGLIKRLDQAPPREQIASVANSSRQEVAAAMLQNKDVALLDQLRKRYDLAFIGFASKTASISEQQVFAPGQRTDAQHATALGDAIRDVINRKRGQPVAGIFIITDGASNFGSEPLDAARFAGQENMPLYPYGVGITSPRDILVSNVFTQDVAFIKDELPVTVRLRAQGLTGERARLVLKLGDQEVASKDLEFANDAEQVVPLVFTPGKTGEFELTASIEARTDETTKDNNSASQRLRVIDSRIKVLFVERTPRWDFRYILPVLLRDRRIEAKVILFDGDPQLASAPDSPYLEKFPATKEELFKYDLVILGDVDPKSLTGPQLEALAEFVSKFGGACAFIAGQLHNPGSYKGTPIEKMIPVEWDASPSTAQRAAAQRPTTLALTAAGRTNPMLKLSTDEMANLEIWKKFPPIYWVQPVTRPRAGAQVLLEDVDPAKATRFGRMPVMVVQQYGVGQALYLGTDDTWRWRQEEGIAYHRQFWSQIVQRMAIEHLLGGSKRTQLSTDKQRYTTGERVTVFARLYDANFAPITEPSVEGYYIAATAPGAPAGVKQDVSMRAVPDQPGMFRGEFITTEAGNYKFLVSSDPQTALEFSVIKPQFELGDPAMREPLLKELARLSGGAFFREENLGDLPEKLGEKDERMSRVIDADIWSSPLYFLLMFGVVTAEWILRKRYQLK